MIALGTAVVSEAEYRALALPGIRRVSEPDSLVLVRRGDDSLQAAYNRMLDEAGARPDLEVLVLLHEDVEIVDPDFTSKLRRRITEADVAVVGVVGARGVRSLAWWEADCFGSVAAPALAPGGRIECPGRGPQDVDVVDGLLMALSPWAVRNLRFDEAFAPDFHGYDVDFCFQARALGRRVVVDELAVAHHAVWAPRYGEEWVRSAVALKRKWGASWAPGECGTPAEANRERAEPATRQVGDTGGDGDGRIKAENVVWLFSFGRSGSTWLSSMMAEIGDYTVWHEPGVAGLFGSFYYNDAWIGEAHRKSPLFILGSQRALWLRLIRSFFLESAGVMLPEVANQGAVIVRETYGSIGAPLRWKPCRRAG